MKKILSNSIKVSVSLIISAVILYFLYRDYDFSGFRAGLSEMKLGWLWAALLFSAIGPLLRGLRWNLLLEPVGYHVPYRDTILTVFTGYAANIIIPRFGEISRCAILDRNNHVPFSKGLGTLAAERFVDLILLILVSVSTFILQSGKFIDLFKGKAGISSTETVTETVTDAPESISLLQNPTFWISAAAAVILIILCRFLWKRFHIWQHIVKLKFVQDFWSGFIALKQVRNLPLFLFYSVGIWICYYLEMYLAFFCISSISHVGPLAGLVCFVAGSIAVLVPTPNGAGPWHFAVMSMLVLYGAGLNDAKTFALVLHTAQTATYLLCGVLAWIALHFVRRK